ncbi:MAG: homoserine kinase [Candidatus Dormibacteraeota bacterium]|nr:homoserine kinase [Candidatus Dormibacteraeota bacterium]MBV9525769.1 homoserine kinase [Candidatus Dormibacteraeota bacterium]
MRVKVAVPATVANLGAGFDVFAMALQLQNEVSVASNDSGALTIDPGADAPGELCDPERNLVTRAFMHAERALGVEHAGADFTWVTRIPMSRGLGSSAAAALAGVLSAVALHHAPWDEHDVIDCAAALEGHRDNAAAALLGGLAVCAPGAQAVRIDVPDELRAVLFLPEQTLPTQASREVVPRQLSRDDAVFNASRCALFVRALMARDWNSLGVAMEDRWHQAARSALAPHVPRLIEAAREAGAAGAALAGAGPSVIALVTGDHSPVEAAMRDRAAAEGVSGTTLVLPPRNFGARVDVRP